VRAERAVKPQPTISALKKRCRALAQELENVKRTARSNKKTRTDELSTRIDQARARLATSLKAKAAVEKELNQTKTSTKRKISAVEREAKTEREAHSLEMEVLQAAAKNREALVAEKHETAVALRQSAEDARVAAVGSAKSERIAQRKLASKENNLTKEKAKTEGLKERVGVLTDSNGKLKEKEQAAKRTIAEKKQMDRPDSRSATALAAQALLETDQVQAQLGSVQSKLKKQSTTIKLHMKQAKNSKEAAESVRTELKTTRRDFNSRGSGEEIDQRAGQAQGRARGAGQGDRGAASRGREAAAHRAAHRARHQTRRQVG
jgi:DNA repair exonuclease SbcCD ATPase subunit